MDDHQRSKPENLDETSELILSLPVSVQKRVLDFSEECREVGEALHDKLRKEAHCLAMYDSIYAHIDSTYDLPNPILSRAIRGCIDHGGSIPNGSDRDFLLSQYPQILSEIEISFKNTPF